MTTTDAPSRPHYPVALAVRTAARTSVLDALAVVMPVSCAGCGAPDRVVCASCSLALRVSPRIRHLALPGIVGPDGSVPPRTVPVGCGSEYAPPWPALVSALKEEGRTDAARTMSAPLLRAIRVALAAALPACHGDPRRIEILGVPSPVASIRRRGYAPVEILLARAGIRTMRAQGLPHFGRHPLRFTRRPVDQAGLGVAAREANVHGSLAARVDLTGRVVLVVDDVLTTGATLRETSRAVRAAGGDVVACAVLTAVPARRHARSGRAS